MRSFLLSNLIFLVLIIPITSNANEHRAGKQKEKSHKTSTGVSVPYLLYLPKTYTGNNAKDWPIILFLHGRGESRGPLSIVAKWGPPRMAARGDPLNYIIISPQCPSNRRWTSPDQIAGVMELLDHILQNYSADPTRVYLTGLSMGGSGSWKLAAEFGHRFAAVIPICGTGNPEDAEKLRTIPIWIFHGTEDKSVPYERSVIMANAIRKSGENKLRFTTMNHMSHNCWSAAYATPELYEWFNKHQRKAP